jgi:ketosteroid isomerase-like protein
MSQENVELVLRAYPAPEVNVAALARDDHAWEAWLEANAQLFFPDVESVWPGLPGGTRTFTGFDGMRAALLDWTAPWETYRTEVEEALDCGERVVLIAPSYGRLPGSTEEIRLEGANLWTVGDGKVARVYHSTRADVFNVVGLAG